MTIAKMKLSHVASFHYCSMQRDSCAGGIQNRREEEK